MILLILNIQTGKFVAPEYRIEVTRGWKGGEMSSHCSAVTGFLFGGDENIWGHSGSGRTVLGMPSMPLSRTPKMAKWRILC